MRVRPALTLLLFQSLFLAGLAAPLAAQAPDLDAGFRAPVEEARDAGGWRIQLGAMALGLPRYPGSGDSRVVPLPVFSAEYGRLFLGSSRVAVGLGGGVHAVRTEHWTWDLGLGLGEGRKEARADVLAGMGDRRASLFAGTGLRFHAGGFHAGLKVAEGLRDEAGGRASLTVGYGASLGGRWFGDLSAGAEAADAKGVAYDYGVTPDQAAARAALIASGDPRLRPGEDRAFTPGGGLERLALTGLLAFAADAHWRWFGLAQVTRLQGDAKD
ncbi:MAG TPA: MipA/OmpV family protein, partial [Holophagaceae bacterium]|nr:MipA/OmpV family protein [Holophagaceae bacterium]